MEEVENKEQSVIACARCGVLCEFHPDGSRDGVEYRAAEPLEQFCVECADEVAGEEFCPECGSDYLFNADEVWVGDDLEYRSVYCADCGWKKVEA